MSKKHKNTKSKLTKERILIEEDSFVHHND